LLKIRAHTSWGANHVVLLLHISFKHLSPTWLWTCCLWLCEKIIPFQAISHS